MQSTGAGHFQIQLNSVSRRTVSFGATMGGPCSLAVDAMRAWSDRNVSTAFLVACISTALVWTTAITIAILQLAALAANP